MGRHERIKPPLSRRLSLRLITGGLALALAGTGGEAAMPAPPAAVAAEAPAPTPTPTVPAIHLSRPLPSAAERGAPREYPVHRRIVATRFWIGESAATGGIANTSTHWDEHAVAHFGGVDDPKHRTANGLPAGFKPLQNPYYAALPINEFGSHGVIPGAREASPWASEAASIGRGHSLFKGRWVRITNEATGITAWVQVIDTGPGRGPRAGQDYRYAFGNGLQGPHYAPRSGAGIDVSPAAARSLGMSGMATVSWQFVDAQDVPNGPWKDYPAINNRTYH